ncbi:MAG: hypothetical protein ACO3H6_01000, partial [Bacilli bacterium]
APFMWIDQAYLIIYGSVGLLVFIIARKVGQFSLLTIVFYPIYLLFFVGLFIRSSQRLKRQKTVTWKGRTLDL